MAPAKVLAQLALQKRFLLAESEAQRLVLTSELRRAIRPFRWLDRLQVQARPVLMVGVPVAGLWLAHRSKGLKRWVPAGLGALRLLKSLRRMLHR
jgi:hypothetical protein